MHKGISERLTWRTHERLQATTLVTLQKNKEEIAFDKVGVFFLPLTVLSICLFKSVRYVSDTAKPGAAGLTQKSPGMHLKPPDEH